MCRLGQELSKIVKQSNKANPQTKLELKQRSIKDQR